MANPRVLWLTTLSFASSASSVSCTSQLPDSFRYLQQEESFDVAESATTKVDMLFVIDNSASMDVAQAKLRKGFDSFARKTLGSSWDLQAAAIPTDAYLANPAYREYLATALRGTAGWTSASTGKVYSTGLRPVDLVPAWGPDYAKLVPGIHDGPVLASCLEAQPHYFRGPAQCARRVSRGIQGCLSPDSSQGQTERNQCLNTPANDTVRSGAPIVSTGQSANARELAARFAINVMKGASGHGSERGLSSLLQFLSDNEKPGSWTRLFRPGSTRVLVFASDEDDQSMRIEAGKDANPDEGYLAPCQILSQNGSARVIDRCPEPSRLLPVAEVKTELDRFFTTLDGADGSGTYLVAAIVPISEASIRALEDERARSDSMAGAKAMHEVDYGRRYLALARTSGKDALAMDLASEDYGPLLDSVGRAVVSRRGGFELGRAPTGKDEMTVTLVRAGGESETIAPGDYELSGRHLSLTRLETVLAFSVGDRLVVSYQPKGAF